MKKFAIILLGLFTCSSLFALPIGNPTEIAQYRQGVWLNHNDDCCFDDCNRCNWLDWCHNLCLRFGYYGDFVFNRHLKIQGDGLNQGKVIRRTEINTNAGYLALSFCNRIDLFATLGATNFTLRTNETSWVFNGSSDGALFTDTNFSWSIGARGILFDWNCFSLGVEGQYFQASPNFSHYISSFVGDYVYFNNNNHVKYREWQFGGVLAYTLHTQCPDLAVIPYVGGKWSHAQFTTHNFQFIGQPSGELFTIFDLKSQRGGGFAVGSSFIFCNRIGLTVEGRFGDERGLFVNGQICF